MLKKSISYDSFFKYNSKKPLISSYRKFIQYCNYNNIIINNKIRRYALCMWWNHIDNLKKYLGKIII